MLTTQKCGYLDIFYTSIFKITGCVVVSKSDKLLSKVKMLHIQTLNDFKMKLFVVLLHI